MSTFDDELGYELADGGDDRVGLEELDDDLAPDLDDDEDDDEDFDDPDDFDEFDDLDDASEEDVDFAVAMYREDGQPVAVAMSHDVTNDLEELIAELGRFPGDAGALGVVSIAEEFFVLARVRGKNVQVMLSDVVAAGDWPLARDVADFLGEDEPDEDEPAPVGDLGMLADLGCDEFELEQLCLAYDESSEDVALAVIDKLGMGEAVAKVVD